MQPVTPPLLKRRKTEHPHPMHNRIWDINIYTIGIEAALGKATPPAQGDRGECMNKSSHTAMGGIPHTACPPRNSGMATPTISDHALGSCGEVCHQEKGTEKAEMSCFTPLSCKDGMKKTYALLETASGRSSLSIRAMSRRIQKALQNYWDMPALGTCPLKCLGHARSWDMPLKMFGICPLLGRAL